VIVRRGFLTGLLTAPAIIRTPGLLMPIRPWMDDDFTTDDLRVVVNYGPLPSLYDPEFAWVARQNPDGTVTFKATQAAMIYIDPRNMFGTPGT
jgi:hypothetical protein